MPDRREIPGDDAGGAAREARRERAAAEAEGEQLRAASRSLVDVVAEVMQRGGRVRVSWPGGELVGVPSAAVSDLVVLRIDEGAAGVNTGVLTLVEPLTGDQEERGVVGDRMVESFVAWCRMLVGRRVRVSTVGGRTVEGTLGAVARDHVLLESRLGGEVAVARARVAVVSVAGEVFAF